MPTYEYACTNAECGNRFDLVQSFSDPSATECPVCGQPVRKVYGAVGVVFKGSGFYRNDSREADGRKASAASSASSGDAPAKPAEKSGDKVAASSSSSSESSSSESSSSGSSSAASSAKPSGSTSGSTSTAASTPAAKSA